MCRAAGQRVVALALALAFLTGGCASIPQEVRLPPHAARSIELEATPFFPQERYQCGPAALATVLRASGVEVSLDALIDRVYLPGRRGSLGVELMAAVRESGRLAYALSGTLEDVVAELVAGRPVLVFQNLGVAWIPRWHYAVIIGYDAERDHVLLRSGVDRRRSTPATVFLRTWQRAGFWSMVALRPGDMPARPDRARYFRAAAGLETAGRPGDARLAWRAALDEWPLSSVPPFALGNISLGNGENDDAVRWYRRSIALDGEHWMAHNNLAFGLAALGRQEEARRTLRDALARAADDPVARSVLESSLEELEAAASDT